VVVFLSAKVNHRDTEIHRGCTERNVTSGHYLLRLVMRFVA